MITIEIRAAEGGDDAKLLTASLAVAYSKLASRYGWKCQATPAPNTGTGNNLIALALDGDGTDRLLGEAGGHRFQRIPPTERRGRVHTSSVTVAVIRQAAVTSRKRHPSEFHIEWFSGTGKGGQHRNKHQNCCRVMHLPTRIVKTATGRERTSNLRAAMADINAALDGNEQSAQATAENAGRKAQIGSGMRGDKRRTYRFQDDKVHDHGTEKRASAAKVMDGYFDLLWS